MSAKRKRSNALSIYADEIVSSPPYPSPTSSRKKQKTQQNQQSIITDQDLDNNYSTKILSFKNVNYERAGINKKQKKPTTRNLKQSIAENYDQLPADVATYMNIEAPPSMLPTKKYSDISGYVAKYTDPQTGLRYSTVEEYRKIKTLSEDTVQQYLLMRKAMRAII